MSIPPADTHVLIAQWGYRRAVVQPATSRTQRRVLVVEVRPGGPDWPPHRILAQFSAGAIVQSSSTLLADQSVLVGDVHANQVLFRSINLQTLHYDMQLPVPGTFPEVWPIGVDVDDSGRFGLFGWGRQDRPSMCIYDTQRRSTHYLDCSKLVDADITALRWGPGSCRRIACFDQVREEHIYLPISRGRVLWEPEVIQESQNPLSPVTPRPGRQFASSTLAE